MLEEELWYFMTDAKVANSAKLLPGAQPAPSAPGVTESAHPTPPTPLTPSPPPPREGEGCERPPIASS